MLKRFAYRISRNNNPNVELKFAYRKFVFTAKKFISVRNASIRRSSSNDLEFLNACPL